MKQVGAPRAGRKARFGVGILHPKVYLFAGLSRHSLRRMEKQDLPEPMSPLCLKCGEQPKFLASVPSPSAERTFHMFECRCGDKTWTSVKGNSVG
jgi:hypothetical protein